MLEEALRLHVVIDAATLERQRVTGHPRLLRLILDHEPRTVLVDVHIEAIRIAKQSEQGSGGDAKEAVEGEGKG